MFLNFTASLGLHQGVFQGFFIAHYIFLKHYPLNDNLMLQRDVVCIGPLLFLVFMQNLFIGNQPVIFFFVKPNSFKFTTSQLFFQLKMIYIANAVVVFIDI